jgi:NADPH2:quinone reductase
MQAAYYNRLGPAAEVIEIGELAPPRAAPGEVLVQIRASGVNPHDVKKRSGWIANEPEFPVIPHGDGAGVIVEVGDGVAAARIGERVWMCRAGRLSAAGTAAELVTVAAELARPLPAAMSFAQGACIAVPAVTAHSALLRDGPVAGKTVLVAGGAGAVGHLAIQLAKQEGARVLATVSSEEKARHARAGGADACIDYRREDVIERALEITEGAGVDRIIEVDFGANIAIDHAVLKPAGIIASYSSTRVPEPVLPYYPLAFKGVTVHFVQAFIMAPEALATMLDDLDRRLAAGTLAPTVARRFPLAETALAHEALEAGGHVGGIVVEIDDEAR